jgi:hypothetical protein
MLDLAVELWRVHRILHMLLSGSVCRVRALHMSLGDMFEDVRAWLLSAELLRGVMTWLVECIDGGG